MLNSKECIIMPDYVTANSHLASEIPPLFASFIHSDHFYDSASPEHGQRRMATLIILVITHRNRNRNRIAKLQLLLLGLLLAYYDGIISRFSISCGHAHWVGSTDM